MTNLLIILAVLFVALLVLVKVLDGRASPLTAEQQARLSKWLMILVFISIVLALFRNWM
jgi:hypothetical protein